MIGPIKGKRLASEIKLQIVRAVCEAKRQGLSFERACEAIMLDPRRLRRWIDGRNSQSLSEGDLTNRPPVAKVIQNKLTDDERSISSAATARMTIQWQAKR